MIINHNLSAMFAQRQGGIVDLNLQKDIERLSSGIRINRAGDDAAGLAVSEKMRSQIRGLNQASKNTQDGISFIQTSEGYLEATSEAIQRIRELAVQSSNGIYSNEDRMQIQVEVSQLINEVDRIASSAQFNGLNMLTGRFASRDINGVAHDSMWFHMGANMDQRRQVFIGTMSAAALGIADVATGQYLSISSANKANMTIGFVDLALTKINKQRADLGAYQNRLEKAMHSINNAAENMQASESRIRDSNMASESISFAKNNILVQSSTAMLAQANQKSQNVLTLLR